MGTIDNEVRELRSKGWTPIEGKMYITNTRTGETVESANATRLVSPDGKSTYRVDNGVLSTLADEESRTIQG